MDASTNSILDIEAIEVAAAARWNRLLHVVDSTGVQLPDCEVPWRSSKSGARLVALTRRILCHAQGHIGAKEEHSSGSANKVDRFLDQLQSGLQCEGAENDDADRAIGFAEPLLRAVLTGALKESDSKFAQLQSAGFGQLLGIERGCIDRCEKVLVGGLPGAAPTETSGVDAIAAATAIVHAERLRVSHRQILDSKFDVTLRLRAMLIFTLSTVDRWFRILEASVVATDPVLVQPPDLHNEFFFDDLLPLESCESRRQSISLLVGEIHGKLKRRHGAIYAVLESPGWGKSHSIRHTLDPFMRNCRAVDLSGVQRISTILRLLAVDEHELPERSTDALSAEALALALTLERPQLRVLVLQHIRLASTEVSRFAEDFAAAFMRRGGICLVEGWPTADTPASWIRWNFPGIIEPEITSWVRELAGSFPPSESLLAGAALLGGNPVALRALCQFWRDAEGKILEDDLLAAVEEVGRRRAEWTQGVRAQLVIEFGDTRAEALLCITLLAPGAQLHGISWINARSVQRLLRWGLAKHDRGGGVIATMELRAVALRELSIVGRSQVERLKPLIAEPLGSQEMAISESVADARIDVRSAVALLSRDPAMAHECNDDPVMLIAQEAPPAEVAGRLSTLPPGALAAAWPTSVVLEEAFVHSLGNLLRSPDLALRRELLRCIGSQDNPPPVSSRCRCRLMVAVVGGLASLRVDRTIDTQTHWIQSWAVPRADFSPDGVHELRFGLALIEQARSVEPFKVHTAPLTFALSAVAKGLGARWVRRVRIELEKVRIEDWRSADVRAVLSVLGSGEASHDSAYVLSCIASRVSESHRNQIRARATSLIKRASELAVVAHFHAVDWHFECPTVETFNEYLVLAESEPLSFLGTLLNADLHDELGEPKFRWRVASRCRACLASLSRSTVECVQVGTRCMDLLNDLLCDEAGGLALRDHSRQTPWVTVDGRQVRRAVDAHDDLLASIASCENELAAAHLLAHWTEGRIRSASLLGRVTLGAGAELGVGSGNSGHLVRHSLALLSSTALSNVPIIQACRAHLERYLWNNESAAAALRAQCPGEAARLLPYRFAESMLLQMLPAALMPATIKCAVPDAWDALELGQLAMDRLRPAIRFVPIVDPFEADILEFAWQCLEGSIDWNAFERVVGSQFVDPAIFWDTIVAAISEGRIPILSGSLGKHGYGASKVPRLAAIVAMYGAGNPQLDTRVRRRLADMSIAASILAMHLHASRSRQSLESPSIRWLVARAVICGLIVGEDGMLLGSTVGPFPDRMLNPRSWSRLAADWSHPLGLGLNAFDIQMATVRTHFLRQGVLTL